MRDTAIFYIFISLIASVCSISLEKGLIASKISIPKIFPINEYYTCPNNLTGFDYRIFLYGDKELNNKNSFWHDINYFNSDDNSYNIVIEIPKGDTAKMEMTKDEDHNPIRQDVKINVKTGETQLRFYKITTFFNYGFIPQTWENNVIQHYGKYVGDDDPIDIVELSESKLSSGSVIRGYILGSFCL